MRRTFFLLVLGALLTGGGAAVAATKVPGDYMFAGELTCLNSSGGFNSDGTPIGSTWINTGSEQGIYTFKIDHTGSAHYKSVGITHPGGTGGSVGASTQDITFNFTYTVAQDGSITTEVAQPLATFLDGPRKGQQTVLLPSHFSGTVSSDYESMTLATPAAEVATATLLPYPCSGSSPICVGGMLTTPTTYKICHRSRVLIRLGQ